jgi:cell fate (sporulation/competence/biofilm development) regulator YmcA (YheA/YmcA/DUF963 family)
MITETVKQQAQITDGTYLQLAAKVLELRTHQKNFNNLKGGYDTRRQLLQAEQNVDTLLNQIFHTPIIKKQC